MCVVEEHPELEGREPMRQVTWEQFAGLPANYFLCQASPLVIKVAGKGPNRGKYFHSRR